MKGNGSLTILTHTYSVEKLNRIEKEYKEKSGFFCNAIPLHQICLLLLHSDIYILEIMLDSIGVPPFQVAVIKLGLCFIALCFLLAMNNRL